MFIATRTHFLRALCKRPFNNLCSISASHSFSTIPNQKTKYISIAKFKEISNSPLFLNVRRLIGKNTQIHHRSPQPLTKKTYHPLLLNLWRFQIEREKVFNIPNTLTISRIIITPIIGYHIVSLNFITASVLLITAGITEYPYFNITVF
jgi:hypothetical protein